MRSRYARKLAAKYGTRLIWKTTTVEEWDQEPHHMNRVVADLAKEHGFEVCCCAVLTITEFG